MGSKGNSDTRDRPIIAVFGPTAIGKTSVALALSELLRERGEEAVAINCDSIQVYEGLELISGAATAEERNHLEHRLLSFVPIDREFSAGQFSERAHEEIDYALAEGRWPILVGGTGLYLRAALTNLEMRPPVEEETRRKVELELEERGAAALHSELPRDLAERVHPNDRKRVARLTELIRSGIDPHPDHEGGGQLWTASLRHPTVLIGLVEDDDALLARIRKRVEAMDAAGAADEANLALERDAARTVRAAIGFEEFRSGDLERVVLLHRRYGRRQMTWMRRMGGVEVIDRTGLDSEQVAERILEIADRA